MSYSKLVVLEDEKKMHREGDKDSWNFLWSKYLQSNNANEKNTIMSALACTEEVIKIIFLAVCSISKM